MPENEPPPADPTGHAGPVPAPGTVPGSGGVRSRRRVVRPADRTLLPDTTGDERDIGWGDLPEPDDDERLLREVPPHHGG